MKNVAYLGPEGTFSHMAAIKLYGDSAGLRPADTIEDVFEIVERDECSTGIVPVENSYEGAVNITLDLLYKHNLRICAEAYVRIRHHLLSMEGDIRNIRKIYSHPMALAQCRSWLRSNMPGVPLAEVSSTSMAAGIAAKEPGAAAIGNMNLSVMYGLRALKENIEDHPDNVTRFAAIGKGQTAPSGDDKTSILFFLADRPGALYKALGALAKRGINMTRIESRPMKTRNWEYLFFADLEGHEQGARISEAFSEMERNCVLLKRLGSYRKGKE